MPQLRDYPRYAYQILTGVRARMEHEATRQRCNDLAPYLPDQRALTILDIGNGRLRPQYAILRNAGHRVVGVDFVNGPNRTWQDYSYAAIRRMYTAHLRLAPTAMEATSLVRANVNDLPFPESSFDLAISMAAFEHFLDVPRVLDNVKRVLRPGGLLWIAIHIFTSPSGGHNLSFTEYPLRTLPPGVEPWDHLRKRTLPFTVPLNEWRVSQYLQAFAERFEILNHYCGTREGEQWLTPDVVRALPGFTTDELTCGTLIIVARNRIS